MIAFNPEKAAHLKSARFAIRVSQACSVAKIWVRECLNGSDGNLSALRNLYIANDSLSVFPDEVNYVRGRKSLYRRLVLQVSPTIDIHAGELNAIGR